MKIVTMSRTINSNPELSLAAKLLTSLKPYSDKAITCTPSEYKQIKRAAKDLKVCIDKKKLGKVYAVWKIDGRAFVYRKKKHRPKLLANLEKARAAKAFKLKQKKEKSISPAT